MRRDLGGTLLEVLVALILLAVTALGLLAAQQHCQKRFITAGIALDSMHELLLQIDALEKSRCAPIRAGLHCSYTGKTQDDHFTLYMRR